MWSLTSSEKGGIRYKLAVWEIAVGNINLTMYSKISTRNCPVSSFIYEHTNIRTCLYNSHFSEVWKIHIDANISERIIARPRKF